MARWNSDGYTRLIGRTVHRILVNEGEDALILETEAGAIRIDTDADCCSETWFADILGLDALRGHTINKAEDIEVPEPANDDGRGRQEVDSFYGIRLTTDAGVCEIVYRNSSNGYYGGDAHVADGYAALDGAYREIVGDEWSA